MKLYFGGDLAWPEPDAVDVAALRQLVADGRMVVNLEGGAIPAAAADTPVKNEHKFNLYSHACVMELLGQLNVVAAGLANNHISDYVGSIETSKTLLAERGIGICGTREHPWCRFTVEGREFVVFAACSPLPEPRRDQHADEALVFQPPAALAQLRELRRNHPGATLVAFMHWGYELAKYPQPADREWARAAVDAGVDYVIGHHPHLVQGLEQYNGSVIAYSLGNLVLPQVPYRGRKLHYGTEAVRRQLVLELEGDRLRAHWLSYSPDGHRLAYLGVDENAVSSPELAARTPFAGMDDAAYRRWFASTGRHGTEGKAGSVVLWSYKGLGNTATNLKFSFLKGRAAARSLAIRTGLHKPYNW
jgi:Bacterial capsule synthesis protein PGA_cap